MATETTNLHLVKPGYDDLADVAVINDNMDIIDTAMNDATKTTSAQWTMDATNVTSTDTRNIKKQGKVVFLSTVNIKLAANLGVYGYVTVGTIPTGYRPTANVYGAGSVSNGNVTCYALTDGTLCVRNVGSNAIAAGTNISISLTYLTS